MSLENLLLQWNWASGKTRSYTSHWSPVRTSPGEARALMRGGQQEMIEGHISEQDTHAVFLLERPVRCWAWLLCMVFISGLLVGSIFKIKWSGKIECREIDREIWSKCWLESSNQAQSNSSLEMSLHGLKGNIQVRCSSPRRCWCHRLRMWDSVVKCLEMLEGVVACFRERL